MTETDTRTTQFELAPPVASSCPIDPETFMTTYNELNAAASGKAKNIADICMSVNSRWQELLPILDDMQSFLSQRGEARWVLTEAKLPSWSAWWKSFRKETGLNASLRTMQKHLSKYRAKGQEKQKRPNHAVRLSAGDQMRVLTALQCANEMAAAIEAGGDYHDPLSEFQRIGIDSDHIGRLLESIRAGTATLDSALKLVVPTAAALLPVAVPPTSLEQIGPTSLPSGMPKAGDCIGLFNIVNGACGDQIRAALRGLSPDLMANTFGKFVNRLALANCHFDQEAGEIRVTVEYLSNSPSALGLAA